VTGRHVTVWGSGERALLVHGSFSWGQATFSEQRPLGAEFELHLLDRRGYGKTPAAGRVDFERDAEDVAALLDEPAHLLGHSYGGLVALLATARRPDGVRTLTVVEPPAFSLVRGEPAVEDLVARVGDHVREGQSLEPGAFLAGFLAAWGFAWRPPDRLAPPFERAIRSSMGERLPWEAEIPLERLARARVATLVVSGAWDAAPAEARERAGRAFRAVCERLEERLGAERAVFEGANHEVQRLGAPFNERVAAFWRAVEDRGG
jgi:pimeloyl-ACP methyl ester carboxylesterase